MGKQLNSRDDWRDALSDRRANKGVIWHGFSLGREHYFSSSELSTDFPGRKAYIESFAAPYHGMCQ